MEEQICKSQFLWYIKQISVVLASVILLVIEATDCSHNFDFKSSDQFLTLDR
jgi:hypothetical protein